MSYPEVLAQMRALLPVLRARVPETTQLRRLPEATCEDIRKSGLARILQPARYGGAEAPLEIHDRCSGPGGLCLQRNSLVSRAVHDAQLHDRAVA